MNKIVCFSLDSLRQNVQLLKSQTIIENPRNNQSINVPLHREEIAVWIYLNVLRRLGIDKDEFERDYL